MARRLNLADSDADSFETTPFAQQHYQYDGSNNSSQEQNVSNSSKFFTRLRYYIPSLYWIPNYDLKTFPSDFLAALTVACLSIPQGLSYASAIVHLPPVYGLYVTCVPLIVYALFGTSRQISIGPEALIAMLVGSAIFAESIAAVTVVGFLVGLFTLLLGLFRVGFLDSILSRSLLRGFITALAVIIIVGQSVTLLGLDKLPGSRHGGSTVSKFLFILENLGYIHWQTALLSGASLLFLFSMQALKRRSQVKWFQYVPEFLIVCVLSTIFCKHYKWDEDGVMILGPLEHGKIPTPRIPPLLDAERIHDVLIPAVLTSIMGFVISAAITKTYAIQHNYSVSPNRELVALGVANIVGSLFQTWPAFGSVARSKLNNQVGGRSQLSGLMTGVIGLVAVSYFLPSLRYLPKAVLSSLIFVAGVSLLVEAPKELRYIIHMRSWGDLTLLLITFLVTMAISIEAGTFTSVGLSLLLVVKKSTRPKILIMGKIPGEDKFKPIKEYPEAEQVQGVQLIQIQEALFFANTGQLKDRLRRVEQFGDDNVHPSEEPRIPPTSYVIFDGGNMPEIDASAAQILLEIVDDYHRRGVIIYFVKLRENCKETFTRSGLIDHIGPHRFFRKINEAMEHIELQRDREVYQVHTIDS
ncbi:hypothetical protein K493DRAFT_330179 [Basidiobolus meristosporus CBS 931.73]|uniref:STAS domain-containing protein n=1 Tax=Basidiobolus meristosporus CBS 931.73 TaxID=1314790 RepID=A0A1Y1Y5M2_9FUNG|nr:hypothetical protein K493DRAFT_330179 [Basidiobolus meristosporus CBS 931.73]|eukprot:ORX93293.1 hypothetical protein K493DRAFT_330179 [Basidiobolus meristosporus CBS 931.73]